MSEVLNCTSALEDTEVVDYEEDDVEQSLFPKLDGILFPIVVENAEVIAPCPWMGGAEVSLTVALNNYYQPMTEENADEVIVDVYEFLAHRTYNDDSVEKEMETRKEPPRREGEASVEETLAPYSDQTAKNDKLTPREKIVRKQPASPDSPVKTQTVDSVRKQGKILDPKSLEKAPEQNTTQKDNNDTASDMSPMQLSEMIGEVQIRNELKEVPVVIPETTEMPTEPFFKPSMPSLEVRQETGVSDDAALGQRVTTTLRATETSLQTIGAASSPKKDRMDPMSESFDQAEEDPVFIRQDALKTGGKDGEFRAMDQELSAPEDQIIDYMAETAPEILEERGREVDEADEEVIMDDSLDDVTIIKNDEQQLLNEPQLQEQVEWFITDDIEISEIPDEMAGEVLEVAAQDDHVEEENMRGRLSLLTTDTVLKISHEPDLSEPSIYHHRIISSPGLVIATKRTLEQIRAVGRSILALSGLFVQAVD